MFLKYLLQGIVVVGVVSIFAVVVPELRSLTGDMNEFTTGGNTIEELNPVDADATPAAFVVEGARNGTGGDNCSCF